MLIKFKDVMHLVEIASLLRLIHCSANHSQNSHLSHTHVLQNKLFRECLKTNFWETGTRKYVKALQEFRKKGMKIGPRIPLFLKSYEKMRSHGEALHTSCQVGEKITNWENSAYLNVSIEISKAIISLFEYDLALEVTMEYTYLIEKRLLSFHDELLLNEC